MSAAIAAAPPGAAVPIAVDAPRYPSLLHYGVAVLNTAHHVTKATLTSEAAHFYKDGALPLRVAGDLPVPPEVPARPDHLEVRQPKDMPPAKKGVENHAFNKMRLIHSLCHIESVAIDLSWDILIRFATPESAGIASTEGVAMPKEFYEDWLRVAAEEAKHFSIWNARLEELDSSYGALPVHAGLWQSATETNASLLARLAVVHCVHEARGLDQAPKMLQQLQVYGDKPSMHLLEVIERDELTHVSSGLRWFKYICEAAAEPMEPIPTFHRIVRANFRGSLLPPFNTEARSACGFTPEWYLPLAVKKEKVASAAVAPAGEPAAAAAVSSGEAVPEVKA